jgi:hypothetical protein
VLDGGFSLNLIVNQSGVINQTVKETCLGIWEEKNPNDISFKSAFVFKDLD